MSDFVARELELLGLLPRNLCCCSNEFRFSAPEESGREYQIIARVFQEGFCWRPPEAVWLARENMETLSSLFPKEQLVVGIELCRLTGAVRLQL